MRNLPMAIPTREVRRESEPRYRRRILVAVPPGGFGAQLATMRVWLDKSAARRGGPSRPRGGVGSSTMRSPSISSSRTMPMFSSGAFAAAIAASFSRRTAQTLPGANHRISSVPATLSARRLRLKGDLGGPSCITTVSAIRLVCCGQVRSIPPCASSPGAGAAPPA